MHFIFWLKFHCFFDTLNLFPCDNKQNIESGNWPFYNFFILLKQSLSSRRDMF